ncbi:hypothetical protein [Longimicrobium sp.]|jgi:hypothetical protein|uniref:hypothetical protein n=1 Tax=Longimicrobium sp. TaxID=2029185 RepID=UPI002EDB81A3
MRAPEVLDHKADLMVRLENPVIRRAWRHQVSLDLKAPFNPLKQATPKSLIQSQSAAVVEALRITLPKAEAYHVSAEMGTVVQYAASQLDDLDRIDRTIMPTRSGIARFEGGLPFYDVRGRKMLVSWAVWVPVLANYAEPRHDKGEPFEATVIYLFNDHREEPDDIYRLLPTSVDSSGNPPGPGEVEALDRLLGRWGFIGAETAYDQTRLGPAAVEPDEAKRAEILAEGDVPHQYTNPMRLMHAFWLLLGQTITDTSDAPVDRSRRKRAGRAGIPDRVTVIQLRNRESKKSEGESLVEWSHRWVVRGFWRWQACGPNHPLAQEMGPGVYRARIWIAPFVKGPKDKPLVVTDKVYALHR